MADDSTINENVTPEHNELLSLLVTGRKLEPDGFKKLVCSIDNHDVIAKVFLLEGVPYVFEDSPMRYMIFREQVADRFGVGYQDVCIVGSAKLGFSPSAHKYGKLFAEQSDVDVVVISEQMFDLGTRRLFEHLHRVGPAIKRMDRIEARGKTGVEPDVSAVDWKSMKDGIRNYVFQNFNPGLLPEGHPLRNEIFEKIGSTAPLFLALEPKVFVSRIRCRFFRNWRAAESYYANDLRQLGRKFHGKETDDHGDDSD